MAVSRRRALKGSIAAVGATVAAAAGAAPALAAEGTDAELLAAIGQFNAIEQHIKTVFAVPYDHLPQETWDAHEEARAVQQDEAGALQAPLLERIVSLPCRTAEGQRALAECYALITSEEATDVDGLVDDPADNPEQRVLVALARAVLGRADTFNTARRPPARTAPEALAATAALASADAELVECVEKHCETFDKAWELTAHTVSPPPELEAEGRHLRDVADEFAERAILLPATTREGEIAKMRFLARWTQGDLSDEKWRDPDETESRVDRMAWSLFYDMTGETQVFPDEVEEV